MTDWFDRALKKSGWVNKCLEFNGTKNRKGYGQIWDFNKVKTLHRLSYEKSKGEIPEGLLVRHTCDNPSCWNPEHLIVGTVRDNSRDMIERGRSAKGSKAGPSKLTEDDVKNIKQFLSEGLSQKIIAEKFNVHQSNIHYIKSNKTWSHVL